jgi:hypothetical protein
MAMFCNNAQWHMTPLEHPIDPMSQRWAAPNIAFAGLERHETRQRQVRYRAYVACQR